VESVKAASDIVRCLFLVLFKHDADEFCFSYSKYAPISGTIHEVNETLDSEPGLLNKSPEHKGVFQMIPCFNYHPTY
jgi:Glycine cleavage H-protein